VIILYFNEAILSVNVVFGSNDGITANDELQQK